LFTFMMILLVTGNNYLLMFVGWEGVGVCSYLLVSFWFTRIAANQSSISAFLTNRVGDCFLTIGMLGLLWTLGNIDYSTVFSLAPYINANVVTIIGICLLIGAMAKSAQIGLHVWLPMAMEGPTPVSALIHAATMVTAGVYLLIRSSPLIEYSSTLLLICLWLGAITTLSSSIIGLFQGDIKKIIAYSTMSQLGMMVIAIGLSSYNVALFHLINHAFYKGLLFLGAGAVIHAVVDNQDLRKYGGLIHWLPLTYSVILIASLSLVAFPFMTGFYSKDLILESSYGQYHFPSIAVYFIGVIGALFTTLYSVKVLYLTFIANPNGSLNYYKNAHEGNIFMSIPLVILAIFSIYFGFLTKDIYVGLGSGFFNNNSIFIHPMHEILISAEFGLNTIIKLLPFILTLTATTIAIILLEFYPSLLNNVKLSNLGYNIYGFFNQRLLIELFINRYIVNLVLKLGGQTTKVLDKGSIELIGPFGAEKLLLSIGKIINSLNTGMVTNYALYIIIGIILYLIGGNFYLFNIDNILLLSILGINGIVVILGMKINNINPIVLESNIFNIIKTPSNRMYCTDSDDTGENSNNRLHPMKIESVLNPAEENSRPDPMKIDSVLNPIKDENSSLENNPQPSIDNTQPSKPNRESIENSPQPIDNPSPSSDSSSDFRDKNIQRISTSYEDILVPYEPTSSDWEYEE
jgi:NADH-ubiquinone oxidoreductase chain 5